MRSRPLVHALVALASAGCTAACGGASHSGRAKGAHDATEQVRVFEAEEDEILRDLSAIDRRFAQRARISPREEDLHRVAVAAVLAEDPTVAVIDGSVDPFSFEARARGLSAAKKKIAGLPTNLPNGTTGRTASPAFERELLLRVVDGEVLRLEEERTLPRSASALVRAIVETWSAPREPRDVEEKDRWLARRLDEVRGSLASSSLDPVRARELDDALDALEHLIDAPGFRASTRELVRVREAAEAQAQRPADTAHSEWTLIAERLKAHLGEVGSPESFDRRLAAAQTKLAAEAKAARDAAKIDPDAFAAKLRPLVFASSSCTDQVPGSRVRSMTPPPERSASCSLRRTVAGAGDEAVDRALALAAMHDHVIVARWALDVARGASNLSGATGTYHLLTPASIDDQARYERIALARPVLAIGAGLTAAILAAGDPLARAKSWSAIGDVPLDVAQSSLDTARSQPGDVASGVVGARSGAANQ